MAWVAKIGDNKVRMKILELCGLVCVGLVPLLPLSLVRNITPPAKAATLTATEMVDYIKIENNYYIANITKGWHGHISDFYIKPQTSVNIVAGGHWDFLGGHEVIDSSSDPHRISVDWCGQIYKESQTTEIVYQTSSVVVVKSITEWKNASVGDFVDMRNIEYSVFFADKPYYLVSSNRTYNVEIPKQYNNQYVFLFFQAWANRYYWSNHNGSIYQKDNINKNHGEVIQIWEAQYLQKYPWAMLYNTTYNKGHFTILISAMPHHIGIGMLGYDTSGLFTEYQIHYGIDASKAGDSWYFSIVSGVADDTAYVENLATTLYSSEVVKADLDNSYIVSSNDDVTSDQRKSRIVNQLGTTLLFTNSNMWRYGMEENTAQAVTIGHSDMIHNEWSWRVNYKNASGSYQMLGSLNDFSVSEWTWTESFTNVTWRYDYENKIRTEMRVEMWKDSDSYYQTWNFTTLASANITDLYMYFQPYAPQEESYYAMLSPSVLKFNVSDYYVQYLLEDGIIFQNVSHIATMHYEQYATYGFIFFYALDTTSDTLYNAGQSWTFRLLVQPFRRYKSNFSTYFGLNDITLPEDRKSEIITYNHKIAWSKLIWDTSTPFRLNHYGKGYIISEATATTNKLTFKVVGETGTTSTTKVYVSDKGEPESVCVTNGTLTWSYNASTKTLTLKVSHSGPVEITVDWGILGDIDRDGDVDFDDFTVLAGAYGSILGDSAYDERADFDRDDDVDYDDFIILAGNYGKG